MRGGDAGGGGGLCAAAAMGARRRRRLRGGGDDYVAADKCAAAAVGARRPDSGFHAARNSIGSSWRNKPRKLKTSIDLSGLQNTYFIPRIALKPAESLAGFH